MKHQTIAERIQAAGGDNASFTSFNDVVVYDSDNLPVRHIGAINRNQVEAEVRRGLLAHSTHNNEYWPRENVRKYSTIHYLTLPVRKPTKYHYLDYFDATLVYFSPAWKHAMTVARKLESGRTIRMIYGVGGSKNKLHESDWPILRDALVSVA